LLYLTGVRSAAAKPSEAKIPYPKDSILKRPEAAGIPLVFSCGNGYPSPAEEAARPARINK